MTTGALLGWNNLHNQVIVLNTQVPSAKPHPIPVLPDYLEPYLRGPGPVNGGCCPNDSGEDNVSLLFSHLFLPSWKK